MTGFPSRSLETNWNIYQLRAHQKVSTEKVRGGEPQGPRHCHLWSLPLGPPARGAGVCPGSRKL